MNTDAYRQMDRHALWHPYTKHSAQQEDPFPVIVRGQGIYLYDTDGQRYLDAISSWWACNLGHGHPRLIAAITRQAAELQHSILGNLSHPGAIQLANQLAALFPGSPRRTLFASDGASAIEAALKIAIQYWYNVGQPQRRRFVSLRGGYHGDTLGAVSIGRIDGFHRPFEPLLFPSLQAESPCCAQCEHGRDPEHCPLSCYASMERLIEEHGAELAAVIVEPLCQGAAGIRIYSPRYLTRLAAQCREHGILLIADEVAMGFGRTGKMFACEHAGIDPDITCLGKGLSSGYLPISATVVREKIFNTFHDRPTDHTLYHGHTFTGNPIACAVALETLRIYAEEQIVALAAQRGAELARQMETLCELPGVRNVRCLGMIGAVELGNSTDEAQGIRAAQAVRKYLFAQRMLLRPLGNVIYLMPPFIITPDELTATIQALRAAIVAPP